MQVFAGSVCQVFVEVGVAGVPIDPDGPTIAAALSGFPAAVSTISRTAVGKFTVTFTGVVLNAGDSLTCTVTGTIGGAPFSQNIPIEVVAATGATLEAMAQRPRVVQAGTERIEEHSLRDQIEFDKYQTQKKAQAAQPGTLPVLRWQQTHGRP